MNNPDGELKILRLIRGEVDDTPPPRPAAPPPKLDGDYQSRAWQYIEAIGRAQAEHPAGGRNHHQNQSGYKAFRIALGAGISLDAVEDVIWQAQCANGQVRDDGEHHVRSTIRSARNSAEQAGADYLPDNIEKLEPAMTLPVGRATPAGSSDEDGETEAEREARDIFNLAVQRRAMELRLNEEARTYYATWQAQRLGQAKPQPQMLDDMLAIPDEDATYRIENLLPTGGRALLAAQFKAGKTSMMGNLIRALVDGGSFLGTFPVEVVDRITLIDTELDENMLRRWLRDQGIRNTHKVQVFCLKGKLSTFDIMNGHTRALWANDIRGSQFVILDCLRPCLDALGLSEDKDAGKYLVAWDALITEADAAESVVVHHVGHVGERSRGDSRLLDWADVNWKIVKESQQEGSDPADVADGGRRFFSAHGRDVNVPEGTLVWNADNRSLTYREGGRKIVKTLDTIEVIRTILSDPIYRSGIGVVALTEKLQAEGIGKTTARNAIKKAIEEGIVIECQGARNSKVLSINPSQVRR